MNRFKGTTGSLAVEDNGYYFEIKDSEHGLSIGSVCESSIPFDRGLHTCDGVAYANACLFAAAPELLEVLIELVQSYDECRLDHHGLCQEHFLQEANDCTFKKANLAIAKALGESK